MFDFPKAIPEPRGCGEREPGGVYAECGVSPYGRPLEDFLFDPPLPLPPGLDLINKPQLWQRVDADSGEPVRDVGSGLPISDLLIHVGAEYYPYSPDYIEEVKRLGASRKLNPQLDLSLLTRQSRLLLAHPKAIPLGWREALLPLVCHKHRPGHDQACFKLLGREPAEGEREGPCIFKLWELIPQQDATEVIELEGERPLCLRAVGSSLYSYRPSGEAVTAWETGFILGLPLTGLALIQCADGSVNEAAKAKILAGLERHGEMALPFYESDK